MTNSTPPPSDALPTEDWFTRAEAADLVTRLRNACADLVEQAREPETHNGPRLVEPLLPPMTRDDVEAFTRSTSDLFSYTPMQWCEPLPPAAQYLASCHLCGTRVRIVSRTPDRKHETPEYHIAPCGRPCLAGIYGPADRPSTTTPEGRAAHHHARCQCLTIAP